MPGLALRESRRWAGLLFVLQRVGKGGRMKGAECYYAKSGLITPMHNQAATHLGQDWSNSFMGEGG